MSVNSADGIEGTYVDIENNVNCHKWQPQIMMPEMSGKMVDIVPLIEPSHLQKCQFSCFGYPKNSSFHFLDTMGLTIRTGLLMTSAGLPFFPDQG